jgi:hypothetical protein
MAIIHLKGKREPVELDRARATKIRQQKYGDDRLGVKKAPPDTPVLLDDLGVAFEIGDIRGFDMAAGSRSASARSAEPTLSDDDRRRVKDAIERFNRRDDLHPNPVDRHWQFLAFCGAGTLVPALTADGVTSRNHLHVDPANYTYWQRVTGQYAMEQGAVRVTRRALVTGGAR